MKRPIKKDYLTTLPLQCEGSLIDYYKQLEKYVDSLEQQLNLHIVSGSACRCEKCTGLKSAESFYED